MMGRHVGACRRESCWRTRCPSLLCGLVPMACCSGQTCDPHKRCLGYAEVLTSGSAECDLIRMQALYRNAQVQMQLSRWALILYDQPLSLCKGEICIRKQTHTHTHTYRGKTRPCEEIQNEHHAKTEAEEAGIMWPKLRNIWGRPKPEEVEGPALEAFGGRAALPTPGLRAPASSLQNGYLLTF